MDRKRRIWFPSLACGEGHVEQAIEVTGTQHGRADELRTVGRSHDEHVSPRLQAVHFRQDLVNLRRRVSARKAHDEAMAWARIFDGVLQTAILYRTRVFIRYLFFMISPFLGELGRKRLENVCYRGTTGKNSRVHDCNAL